MSKIKIYVSSVCTCDIHGSTNNFCDPYTGHCLCNSNFISGNDCDDCLEGYYGHPNCEGECLVIFKIYIKIFFHQTQFSDCMCHAEGSLGISCNQTTGQCSCKNHIAGVNCDQCEPGYFGFPHCQRKHFFSLLSLIDLALFKCNF